MAGRHKLTFNDKMAYGVGQISETIKNYAFGFLVLFYYNQLLGLSGTLTGLALLIGLCSDAVTDPLIGSISDRWQSRWGRRHPFMYFSILPLAVTFYFTFSPPEGLGQLGLFAWLTFFGVAARVLLTFFHLPHIAMGAELSNDYIERTVVVQYRYGIGVSGQFFVFGLAFLVFFAGEQGQWDAPAYPAYAATLAAIMAVTMLWSTWGTHHFIPNLLMPRRDDAMSVFGLLKDCVGALTNYSFRNYFVGMLLLYVMVGMEYSLVLYVGSYVWELERSQLFYMTIAGGVGMAVGAFLTRALHERFEKKPIVMAGTVWWAAWQVIPIALYLLGWLPAAGTTTLLAVLVVMRFLQSVGYVQSLVTASSMMADVADEYELETGKRQEGVFFGGLSFAAKSTSGLGKFVAGVALDLMAWPTGQNVLPSDVPPEKILGLAVFYGPIIATFGLLSLYFYSKYQIDRERHAQVLAELDIRAQASKESSPASSTDSEATAQVSALGPAAS